MSILFAGLFSPILSHCKNGQNGRVDLKKTQPLVIPKPDFSMDSSNQFDLTQVVPTNMQPTNDHNKVVMQIADRSLNTFWNSSFMKSTSVGKAAEVVKEKVKADVIIKADEPDQVDHRFSFRIETFQALAKLEYTGWVNASLDYNAKEAQTHMKLSEKIFTDKNVFVQHTITAANSDLSTMGISWTW